MDEDGGAELDGKGGATAWVEDMESGERMRDESISISISSLNYN